MHVCKGVHTGGSPSGTNQQANVIEMHLGAMGRSLAQPLHQERSGRWIHPYERGAVHVDASLSWFWQT